MALSSPMLFSTPQRVRIGNRVLEYRLVRSKAARKLRVRVGPNGVEVIQPYTRNGEELSDFLAKNSEWIVTELKRVEKLRSVRKRLPSRVGEILYRGESTPIRVKRTVTRANGNAVRWLNGELVVSVGPCSRTSPARSLELWLRRDARREIERQIECILPRIRDRPERLFVMGQRTKWGNCSSRRNLSFNWRLILAPDHVMRYLVAHEVVHLVVPDHSAKFWLTVQSLCSDMESAKQWLRRHHDQLHVDLETIVNESISSRRTRF
jgi:predicted metal-dependent hydrolase